MAAIDPSRPYRVGFGVPFSEVFPETTKPEKSNQSLPVHRFSSDNNHRVGDYSSAASNFADGSRREFPNYGGDRDRYVPKGFGIDDLEEIETTRRDVAAMWHCHASNTKSDLLSIFAAEVAVAAAQVAAAATEACDETGVAAVAAAKAAAYAAANARAPRLEKLKPETEAPQDYPIMGIAEVEKARIDTELLLKDMCEMARLALEYYKETNDEEFELVEVDKIEDDILCPFNVHHITFTAKPKDKSDSSPKLFFAELHRRWNPHGGLGEYEVKMCMILDPDSPDVVKDCGRFKGDVCMLHPAGVEFWAGPPSGTPEWDEYKRLQSSSLNAR